MSTLLKLRTSNVTPPDKFTFRVPEDSWLLEDFGLQGLFGQIEAHYRRNGYDLPENWKAIVEDQICQRLSGEWCEYESGEAFMDGVNTRFGIEDVVNGTKVLASFTLDGAHTVSQDVANERALACSRCYFNQPVPGCSACYQLLNVIAKVSGGKSTPHDHLTKSCAICHCSNRAQNWLPVEHLEKGVTDQQRVQFSRVEKCWKRAAMGIPYCHSNDSSISEHQ